MDRLDLIPLEAGRGRSGGPLALAGAHGALEAAALVRDADGAVAVVEGDLAGLRGILEPIAFLRVLHRRQAAAPPEAVVVPSSPQERLLLNGARPLGLGVLGPGDVLSIDGADWLAARRFRPEAGPAPQEAASKSCPVCGMALSLGPCAMHRCGIYMHFSGGTGDAGEGDLDCYVRSSTCTACGGAISAGEELIPDPVDARWSGEPAAGGPP